PTSPPTGTAGSPTAAIAARSSTTSSRSCGRTGRRRRTPAASRGTRPRTRRATPGTASRGPSPGTRTRTGTEPSLLSRSVERLGNADGRRGGVVVDHPPLLPGFAEDVGGLGHRHSHVTLGGGGDVLRADHQAGVAGDHRFHRRGRDPQPACVG